ncbi:alpha/beta hydrolase, partial [Nocardiopsis sp. frass4]
MATRLRAAVAVTLTGTVLLVNGCTAQAPDEEGREPAESLGALGDFTDQELDWGACDSGPSDAECATYEVPLDYDEPEGDRIEIAVKRMAATGDDVIGSLLVNPGGPGGSGYDYVDHASYIVSEQVRDRFDLIGFDPRGVGRSTPITCLSAAELDEFIGGEAESADGDGDMSELTEAGITDME